MVGGVWFDTGLPKDGAPAHHERLDPPSGQVLRHERGDPPSTSSGQALRQAQAGFRGGPGDDSGRGSWDDSDWVDRAGI